MPLAAAAGVLVGLQTQSAVLGFAVNQTGSNELDVASASVYPVASNAKTVLMQLLARLP